MPRYDFVILQEKMPYSLTGFDVKSNARKNVPCLPNFYSSACQCREKRFSQKLDNDLIKKVVILPCLERKSFLK